MVIKTVASFTARPLLWFSMLATPLLVVGTVALGYSLWRWADDGSRHVRCRSPAPACCS